MIDLKGQSLDVCNTKQKGPDDVHGTMWNMSNYSSWWIPCITKIRTIMKLVVFFQTPLTDEQLVNFMPQKICIYKSLFLFKILSEGKLNSLGDWDLRYQFEPNVLRIENEWVHTHRFKNLLCTSNCKSIRYHLTYCTSFSDFVKNCWISQQSSRREINQETNFTIISTCILQRFQTQSVSEFSCEMTSDYLLMGRFSFE